MPAVPKLKGFTLIELMISITLGLVIISALIGILFSSSSSSKSNERTSELQTNGRYALNALKQELRQAGYRGYTWAEPNAVTTAMGTITGECGAANNGTFIRNIRQGVWGADNSNPFSANCIPAANYASGNDVLVIRYLDGTPIATGALVTNTFYFRSTYAIGEVFRGTTTPTISGAPVPDANFAIQTYVYYISPYTTSATESPLIPALYRVALQPDGSMVPELVVSGIEHMQVQYGRRSTAPNTQYFDEFNAINCPTCINGTSITDTTNIWDEVNSVRIWLLSRNALAEPGYSNTNTYTMGNQSYTVADNFRRQLFTTIVQLRN